MLFRSAATSLSAALAIATLKIPVNLSLFIPLTENLPSGKATKPGDIVIAANGVTIEVDNTVRLCIRFFARSSLMSLPFLGCRVSRVSLSESLHGY